MDQELRREAVAASAGFLIPLGHRRDLGFVPQESPCLPKRCSWQHAEHSSMPLPVHRHLISLLLAALPSFEGNNSNHLPNLPEMVFGFCCFSFSLLLLDHLWKRRGNISITSASTISTRLRGGELRQKAGVVAVGRASVRYLEAVGGRIQIWEHRGWLGDGGHSSTRAARSAVLGEAPDIQWTVELKDPLADF